MYPHATLGKRIRRGKGENRSRLFLVEAKGSGKGGANITAAALRILSTIPGTATAMNKIPFWRTLYRQGRRG